MSRRQKFILAVLFLEGKRGYHFLSGDVMDEFDVDRGSKGELAVHRGTFRRSVLRLEDRGLLVKSDDPLGTVYLTGRGRRVAKEILRRVRDGRYKLEFDHLRGEE